MNKIQKLEKKLIRFEKTSKAYLASVFEAEVHELARATVTFIRSQLKIRPRLRLIARALPVLALIFLASSSAVAYLKPKEAEIKINGHEILVADSAESAPEQPHEEISQAIEPRRFPFEFTMPVGGHLSGGYTLYHRAYDIATSLGSEIHPVGTGSVEFAGFVNDGKGNIVIVDHGDGLKSLYAHMGKIHVGVGNMVNTNTALGTVGLTGRTTGAHVHLEIYDNGLAVDPGNLLTKSGN